MYGPPDQLDQAQQKMVDSVLQTAEQATVRPEPLVAVEEPTNNTANTNNNTNQQLAESIADQAADALAAALHNPQQQQADYKPMPVAQLIGQQQQQQGGHYGPSSATNGQQLEEQIGIPNGVVGFIIGRRGKSISSMQARSGCRVLLQKEHEMAPGQSQRVITLIASSKEAIDMCRGIIESMVQERIQTLSFGGAPSAAGVPGQYSNASAPGTGASSQAVKLQAIDDSFDDFNWDSFGQASS